MKTSPLFLIAMVAAGLGGISCQSASVEKKAEEFRRTGAARDMGEARRMAENYYWPASARTADDERRKRNEVFPPRKDARN
ncbi:MAG: hypothetical protein Q7S40_13050 [Opitutaceae bacterium]|nr:hypothetical protein [Opitutaceae bacterium]